MLALLTLFIASTPQYNDTVPPILLGVLEEPQCATGPTPSLRVLFARDSEGWTSLSQPQSALPVPRKPITWYVTFDGRLLGTLSSRTPTDTGFYFADPKNRFLSSRAVEHRYRVPNPAKRFGGWCDSPARRPIVLLTKPNYRDPAHWKPDQPSPAMTDSLFPAFRLAVPSVYYCPVDPEKADSFAYQASDLTIVRVYRSSSGERLIAVQLDQARNQCDSEDGDEWTAHWFRLNDTTQYLGAALDLVDAGDYDGDGRSDLLFWHTDMNEDGYWLFPQGGSEYIAYTWHYH